MNNILAYNDIPYNSLNINNNYSVNNLNKEIHCVDTHIGKICTYKFNNKKESLPLLDPPYSIDNKYNISENNNNLRDISYKKSCDNINILNNNYNLNTEKKHLSIFEHTDPAKPTDYDYVKDLYILRGIKVNNKSCNTKSDNFNNGLWTHQHSDNISNNIGNNLFNITTKKKII